MFTLVLAISYHLGGEAYDLNYLHPHLRYTTENNEIIGVYYNSIYKPSFYMGKTYMDEHLEVGFVSGYNDSVIPYTRAVYNGFFVSPAVYEDDSVGLVTGYEIGF